jgi:hypothetical protein
VQARLRWVDRRGPAGYNEAMDMALACERAPGQAVLRALVALQTADAVIWGCVLMVVVLGLGGLLMWLRRRYHPVYGRQEDEASSFTIEGLEVLRGQGQISEAEFRRLRRRVLGLDTAEDADDNPASSAAEEDDDG